MKIKLDSPFPLIHPNPVVIIGTKYNDNVNFTTIGDVAVAGLKPALVMISLHENYLSTSYIKKTNKFSINIATKEILPFVDFCGVVSGKNRDKSLEVNYTLINDLPIIDDSPISLLVCVEHSYKYEQRVIMVCRVLETYVAEELIKMNKFDLSSINSVVYGLDNKYYTTNDIIGEGYFEYKKHKKKCD
ncbi:flavin reductase [Mycoplasmatota bacterium WC30]